MIKIRSGYEAHFPNGEIIFVDSQNKDDVYHMVHLYLDDPFVKLYMCWNDGSKQEIVLSKENCTDNTDQTNKEE